MDKYRDLLSYTLDTPASRRQEAYDITNLEVTLDYKWLNWKKIGTYGDPIFGGGAVWLEGSAWYQNRYRMGGKPQMDLHGGIRLQQHTHY